MEKAVNNRVRMQDIKKRFVCGELTYEQAKAEAEPLIEEIYQQSKAIAKKYNKRAIRLSFASLMRL